MVSKVNDIMWLEAFPDAVLLADADGGIVYANQVCQDLLGWQPDEIRGKKVEELIPKRYTRHPVMRQHFMANASRRLMGAGLDLSALHRSGDEIPVDIAINPVAIDGVPHVLAMIRDMSTQRGADLRLRLLSVAVNAAANGVVITDAKGVITWVNPAACVITGYTAEELVGQSTRMLKSGHHDNAFYAELWTTVAAGNVWHGSIVNRRKDGSLYHEEQAIAPVRDAGGKITNYIAIKLDVTARVRAEEMLRTGYSAIRNSANGVAVADLAGRLTYVNPAMLELWGFQPAERMIGVNVVDLFHDRKAAQNLVADVLQERDLWTGEMDAKKKDGSHLIIHVAASRNRDAEEQLSGAVFSFADISDRKRAEEAMKQAEGQKAMLASIAAVCHHLGQPATVIVANAAMMERLLRGAPDDVQKLLKETNHACDELQSMLQRLMSIDAYKTSNYLESVSDPSAPKNQIIEISP